MLKNRVSVAAGFLTLLMGACSACGAVQPSAPGLPSYDSLEDARQAVSGELGCREIPPAPTAVMGADGQISAESVKCTQTVEIFYFESLDARDDAYSLMSRAAQPEPLDLSALSEPLGTRFTEVK